MILPPKAKPLGTVSSHGPGSGAPSSVLPKKPKAPVDPMQSQYQSGFDHYQRQIDKLGPGGDPAQLKKLQGGLAHYQRKLGPAGGGLSPSGPKNLPPMPGGGLTPPGPPLMPPGGGGGFSRPLPPGVGPGPIVPIGPVGGGVSGPLPPGVGPGPMTTGEDGFGDAVLGDGGKRRPRPSVEALKKGGTVSGGGGPLSAPQSLTSLRRY